MIRGTAYAVAEIAVWMSAAALIGGGIGWLLGAWSSRRKLGAEWRSRYRSERDRAEALEAELAELRAVAAERESKLEAAHRRVEALESDAASAPQAGSRSEDEVSDAGEERHGAVVGVASQETTSLAEIATRTRGAADPVDDELSKIPGVGPELEARLKALGITSFRQVANLTPDDVVVVTEALGTYSGRIAHDNWMASAAVEHERKYGDAPD